ncbi:hypothetical protein PTTG_06860 [Puccinia triticina 1-1 BBBD Race 1]|uniref:Uncharacterized protein n=1 Tax=Puccinia triticina (isolate 1-1 / race 1 (BBBD)) TaxID=630390 RepID=A0A180H2I2_PUCT1|nr:hypothetical protein PTTG_06860 [Puccinia triticina 1-1 BBBD Race 1]WAR58712.1 hypothetical protein PtB15_10B50 [Puccinia triticina]
MSFPLRRAAQAFRSRPGTPRRTYAALAGHLAEKPSRASDVGWILAAAAVFVPTMGYLMSPRAAQHSSTSHAHPVEDRWTRSFALEHLDASKLNRPIMAADDGIVPAGEGRPHGPGDKSIRQITKPTESHAGHQVSMQKDTEHIRGSSGKMEHARALSAQRGSEATTIDTKAVQAHAATDRQEKLAASPS